MRQQGNRLLTFSTTQLVGWEWRCCGSRGEVDEEVEKVMADVLGGILDTKVGAGGKASAANRARAAEAEEDDEQMSEMERRLAALG